MGKYGSDEQVKFFYNGEFLGASDPEYMDCRRLYDVMQSDKVLSDLILEYLNSFGDPIYPISDEEWDEPETDSSKLDIWDLYNTFMDWISHEYREYPEDFYVDLSAPRSDKHTLEIFTGSVAEENVVGSKKIKASKGGRTYTALYNGEIFDVSSDCDTLIEQLKAEIDEAIADGDVENIDFGECWVEDDDEEVMYIADGDADYAEYI